MGDLQIRAELVDEHVDIVLLIDHPMETGKRKDSLGATIPAWYLTEMQVWLHGAAVATLKLGPQISRNPVISLTLRKGDRGDILKVAWIDNRGYAGERLVKIS